MYQGGCVHVPRWVCSCTKVGVFMYQGGCEHVPRWVCSCTKVGVFMYQGGCEHVPRWVCSCTKEGVFMYQGGCFHLPRWVCSCSFLLPVLLSLRAAGTTYKNTLLCVLNVPLLLAAPIGVLDC